MPKLVLKVSHNVPDLPAAVRKEKGLAVKRVKTFARSTNADDIVARRSLETTDVGVLA